jgi:tRNA A37 methylthiotransferase MiaB
MSTDDLEYVGKMSPQKQTSLAEDSKNELAEIHADQVHWAKYGTNRSTKAAKSKREIMEELSRERFPWED